LTPSATYDSQAHYVANGVDALFDFAFAGGYIDPAHVKAYYKVGTVTTAVPVTLVTPSRASITGVPNGAKLVIYRDTPRNAPLVDWLSRGQIDRTGLDISAKQALFVAAEEADWRGIGTVGDVTDIAAQASASASSAAASAANANADAISADADATAAAASAAAANAAATLAAEAEVLDFNYTPVFRKLSDYEVGGVVWGFLHTGQSLAEGGVGGDSVAGISPPLYPTRALTFSGGPVGLVTANLSPSLTALAEPSRVTIATSFCRNVIEDVPTCPQEVLYHGQAWGGKNYAALKKGGSSGVYERMLAQVVNAKARRPAIIYRTVNVIHGEQDGLDGNTNYASNLIAWRQDFNTDVQAITGQVVNMLMFICQVGSAGGYGFTGGIDSTNFPSQLEQLAAHKSSSFVRLVCPKYQFAYYDHSHLTNNSQRLLGEYYAKATAARLNTGTWEPLRPSTITGAGNTVTVSFVGAVGNLVFDTTLVQPAANQGFAYRDDSGRTITAVNIVGSQVVITLSGPIGANPKLAYAYNNGAAGTANQVAGLGSRGNLRDSDTAVSAYNGQRLYNWCVIFKENVAV
jgi:hypothetical protein